MYDNNENGASTVGNNPDSGRDNNPRHIPAATAYLIWEAVFAVVTGMVYLVLGVYYVTQVGLTPLQLVLVGTAVEVSAFVFEVPTGVLADTYSRRLSILIGTALTGVWAIMEGALPFFGWIIAAEILRGTGWTFISGAYQAWITDEVGEERAGKLFLRADQIGTIAGLVGVVLGVVIGSVNMQLAIVSGGAVLLLLTVYLAVVMPENGFVRRSVNQRGGMVNADPVLIDGVQSPDAGVNPEAPVRANPFATFREGLKHVRGSRMILILLIAAVITGAFSEGYDRLNEAHWITVIGIPAGLTPLLFFGILSAIGTPFYLIASELVRRYVDLTNARQVARWVTALQAAIILSVLAFALAPGWQTALVAFLVIGQSRGISGTLRDVWLNQNLESATRATAFSMYGQSDAFGQMLGGPVVGAVGNLSLRLALSVSAVLLTPALWLYARTLRRRS